MVHKLRRASGHPPTATTGTKTPPLAREGNECFGVTILALKPREALGPDAAVQEGAELLLEEAREPARIGAGRGGEEGFQMLAHHFVEDRAFSMAGCVPEGRHGRAAFVACGGLAGPAPRSWRPRLAATSLRVDSRRHAARWDVPDAGVATT